MANRRAATIEQVTAPQNDAEKSLNFKVSDEFKREFKGFAVAQGISMTELLKEGFVLSKQKRKK